VTGERGRSKQILDDLKETRGYWELKKEALDLGLWKTALRRRYGSVVSQTDYRMK